MMIVLTRGKNVGRGTKEGWRDSRKTTWLRVSFFFFLGVEVSVRKGRGSGRMPCGNSKGFTSV